MADPITIYNEPCECPPGKCAEMIERDWLCINRLRGDVVTRRCGVCASYTRHHDGQCLRCKDKTDG